jgi:hypothetical protein
MVMVDAVMRRGNLASTQNSQLCAHLDHVI